MDALRRFARQRWIEAMEVNLENVHAALAAVAPRARLLDLGCDTGERTLAYAAAVGADDVHGVEIVGERAARASARGVVVARSDLNNALPYESETFDVVVSNQVIEHVADTDLFVGEIHRVLRPGVAAVTSTENLASWHNIAALVLGWQPFSLVNVSTERLGLGNPFAILRGEDVELAS